MKAKGKDIKKCSLPLFYENGEDRGWLYNYGKHLIDSPDIYNAFANILGTELKFRFEVTEKEYDVESDSLKIETKQKQVCDFNEVIEMLYYYPESFNILENYKEDYSKSELDFVNQLKSYLLLVGLKDKTTTKEEIALERKYKKTPNSKKHHKQMLELGQKKELARSNNKKARDYFEVGFFKADDKMLKAILEGKKKTRIFGNEDSQIGNRYFILDKDNNYKALVEINEEKIIPFKELKVSAKEYRLNNCNSLEEYKEELFNFFNSDIIATPFTEDSKVCVANFSIVQKF